MNNSFKKNGYFLTQITSADQLESCYDSMNVDPYYGSYRYKALGRFNFKDGKIILLPHDDFFQSKDYNPVAGDVVRSYSAIDARIAESGYLLDLFSEISKCINVTHSACYTAHQIRVVSTKSEKGLAAAEGIHQDGYDFIALGCITRRYISGGVTSLYTGKKQKVYEKELVSGDVLFVNDRKLFHYTSPIETAQHQQSGCRDMLIVTVSLEGIRDIPPGHL